MARIFPSAGAAVLATACAALSLTACGFRPVRDEPVALDAVRNAVVLSGGGERTAADGEELGKGDRVRTGDGGTATLVVRGRRVVLGGNTEVAVPDGATVDLARGAVLVDRRRGPGLTLNAGDTTVDEVGDGALRVERSLTVLVAGLSAGARVRTATGTQVDLPALHQVRAAGRALPGAGSPLRLYHDAWERSVVAGLVADDEELAALASGLGRDTVIPVAYRPERGVAAGEHLLAEAMGTVAGRNDEAARRRAADRARELRAAGGSWGVVAALVGAPAADVGTALSGMLDGRTPQGTPASGPPPGVAPTTSPGPGVVAGASPQPPVNGGQPTRSTRPGDPPPTSNRPTSPTPTTASPSSPSVVDQIGKIIPTPLATLADGLLP